MLGTKQGFGVEISIDSTLSGDGWVYGTFVIWVNGILLGDPTNKCTLNSIVPTITKWISRADARLNPKLFIYSALEIFVMLDRIIYGSEHEIENSDKMTIDQMIQEAGEYEISFCDAMDNFKFYVIENDNLVNFIYSKYDSKYNIWLSPMNLHIDKLQFYKILEDVINLIKERELA